MLVLAAFSRRREFRADAGGAQLAGRDKMISALRGLVSSVEHADLMHNDSITAFKISSRPKTRLFMLFSTHPPLSDRIERLERSA
jgi:heat shock protein HtpX